MNVHRAGRTIGVAVVGLGFGEEFLPIYQRHPNVGHLTIIDSDSDRLAAVGDRYGIEDRFPDLASALDDPRVDAVHLLTPVARHAEHAIAVMSAGKHCACAVPMATSLADIDAIMAAQRASGTTYMMMETSVYGREYLAVSDLYGSGRLGSLTFYRGFHIQNLDGFPDYWRGYPPMAYVTHALSPALRLAGATVESVRCLGSGRLTPDRVGDFGNPFPVEAALFRLRGTDMVADVTMSFFQTGRAYTEGFSVYGDRMGVEWPDQEGGPLTGFELEPLQPGDRGRRVHRSSFEPDDYGHLLPAPIGPFSRPHTFDPGAGGPAVRVSAAHGGSHPHLVNEFVRSIIDDRPPAIDAVTAANWTAPGIIAHQSALAAGEPMTVRDYGRAV